jgi:hypothetical protein
MLQSLFYLKIALHVSGITITHLQEHKTTVTTASGNRYTVENHMKTKPDQHATHNTIKSVPTLPR